MRIQRTGGEGARGLAFAHEKAVITARRAVMTASIQTGVASAWGSAEQTVDLGQELGEVDARVNRHHSQPPFRNYPVGQSGWSILAMLGANPGVWDRPTIVPENPRRPRSQATRGTERCQGQEGDLSHPRACDRSPPPLTPHREGF